MERKIGEIFKHKNKWYQCVECDSCGKCSLFDTECGSGTKSDLADEIFGECSKARRTDNKHAIFKRLKKIGKPFIIGTRIFQKYNLFEKSCIFNAEINKEDMKENEENNYLDRFKKLPHLGIDYDAKKLHGLPWGCKVIDDWGYAPNLYHFDTEWHVTWIHCSEGDGILDFHFSTPEECINKAYEFCIKNHLISE